MNNGKAAAIFKDIKSTKYTDEEKIAAIKEVLNFETINSITKRDIFNVLKWLLNTEV